MYLITNTNHCAQPQMGAGEEPFGESPPPLETINKGPKQCTFLHTRPKRTSACLPRRTRVRQSPQPPLCLSPQPSQDLETKRADLFFLLPALLSPLQQPQEQEQASRTHAARLRPPWRRGMLGSGPAPGRRTGAGATGARSRSPFRRLGSPPRTPPSPSPAASRRPGLCPDSAFPPSLPQETKGGFSRVIARPPRGRLSGPQRGRPPHKGTPRAGSPCRRARPRPARELSPTCRCLCVCP